MDADRGIEHERQAQTRTMCSDTEAGRQAPMWTTSANCGIEPLNELVSVARAELELDSSLSSKLGSQVKLELGLI